MRPTKQIDLEIAIDRLVSEHVAALRASAVSAVERAFSRTRSNGVRAAVKSSRAADSRRASDEVAALAESLYAAVCANPGAGMSKLASLLGTSPVCAS